MRRSSQSRRNPRRGGALLAVLWLAVALGAVAFALSRGVRADLDRAALHVDATRAYFLAHGAIEAAMQRIAQPRFGENADPNDPSSFQLGQSYLRFAFASGTAEVEVIGENGKVDVNQAEPDQLARLLAASGVAPGEAVRIAQGIIEYRADVRRGQVSYGLRGGEAAAQFGIVESGSAFSRRSASIQELEELMVVPGVTPDLLFGGYREEDGRLIRFEGLIGNLTTRGSGMLNANYASPEMLAAAGMSESEIARTQEIRRERPLEQGDVSIAGERFGQTGVGVGGGPRAYTLRATAELHSGGARRSVAALVEMGGSGGPDPVRIVRWYDAAF